jgi:membrane protein
VGEGGKGSLGMKKVVDSIGIFFKKVSDDGLAAYAAQITFFVLLAFFPFLIFLILLASKLSVSSDYLINQVMAVFPGELEDYMMFIMDDVRSSNDASFSSFSIITGAVSLWSAAKGIQAMTYGLNKIYNVEKNKNFFLLRLLSALYTFIFAIMIFAIMGIHVFGSYIVARVIDLWPSMAKFTLLMYSLKSGFTFVILFFVFLLIYYQLPGRKGRIKHELTGAAAAALAWMLMTSGFSVFIKYFANASRMYGSLTSIMLLIIWLYIGMQIILYGAEINYYMSAFIEKSRSRHKERKERRKKSLKSEQSVYSVDTGEK